MKLLCHCEERSRFDGFDTLTADKPFDKLRALSGADGLRAPRHLSWSEVKDKVRSGGVFEGVNVGDQR